MLRTQVARNAAEIDRLRDTWEHLHAHSSSATMFQSFAWNRLAAEHFSDRESPCVVLAESDGGAALIPAAVTGHGLTLLGESLFDYRDVLSVGDCEVLPAAWTRLSELHLPLSVTALRGVEASERWAQFCPTPFVTAGQVLCSEIEADDFEQQHGRLRRTLRQLSREGFELRQHRGDEAGLMAWIYEQKAQQIDTAENVFRDPARRDFMIAACAAPWNGCQVFTLESPSKVAAALVTFRDRRVRRFYTIWFDGEWARYSPGTALLFEVTRRSLSEGLDCDYMTGEQPHKLRFLTSSVPLFRVDAAPEGVAAVGGRECSTEISVPSCSGTAGQKPGAALPTAS